MAKPKRKEDAVIRKAEPIILKTDAEQPHESGNTDRTDGDFAIGGDLPNGETATPSAVDLQTGPYAEYGGLSRTLQERREAAARRREEAKRDWERRLAEQQNARIALANATRPQDTSKEQRKLRNLAIGQAVGEFISAMFGGIEGVGKSSGRGYVPKMPGMYENTLKRLQRLKDNDIAANQKFRGVIGSLMARDAADRAALAREQWRDAATEEKQIRTSQDYADREALRMGNRLEYGNQQAGVRRNLNQQQAELRRKLQQERHEQRLSEQRNAAELKGGTDGDVAYVTKLLLPKKRTSSTRGGETPKTTVRDATTYSKQEVAAATALAQQIVPIRKQHGLSDYDVQQLQSAITANPSAGVNWSQIADALGEGYSVDDIVIFIRMN